MRLEIGRGIPGNVCYAPDEGGGGGGFVPPTPNSAAPQGDAAPPAAAPVTESAPAVDPDIAALRATFKNQAEEWRKDFAKKTEGDTQKQPEAKELLFDSKKPETPEAQTETKPPEGEKPPVEEKPAEKPQTPEKFDFNGEQLDKAQVEEHIKYARQAYEFFATKGNEIVQRENAVAIKEQQVNELTTNNADVKILENLKAYPALREKYFEVAAELMPHLVGEHKAESTAIGANKEISELRAELKSMKDLIASKETQTQQQAKQDQETARQAETDKAVTEIKAFASNKAKELGLAPNIVRIVLADAAALVSSGQLQSNVQKINEHLTSTLSEFAGLRKAGEQTGAKNYLDGKARNPPPPPTGGSSPRILPDKCKTFEEAGKNFIKRLQIIEANGG